jgi:hypothetical protein
MAAPILPRFFQTIQRTSIQPPQNIFRKKSKAGEPSGRLKEATEKISNTEVEQ